MSFELVISADLYDVCNVLQAPIKSFARSSNCKAGMKIAEAAGSRNRKAQGKMYRCSAMSPLELPGLKWLEKQVRKTGILKELL